MRKSLLLILSLAGVFVSGYLLWVYTSPSRPMVCLGSGCDVVRASSYARLHGLPLPLYGVAMYVTLALLVFVEPFAGRALAALVRYAVVAISGGGFLFSLYLMGISKLVLHAWCAWCVTSAILVTLIFILAAAQIARPRPYAGPAEAFSTARRHLATAFVAVLIALPAFYWLSRHGESIKAQAVDPEAMAQHLVRPDSHVFGDPQAPVTIVEFGDFECAACGYAEGAAREVRTNYGKRIRFIFRQLPLAIHLYAEKAAEASECAADQGKFWKAVDKLYENQLNLVEPALKRYAGELGLDQIRFNQCLDSGSTAARVRRDVDDAHALNIHQTPVFFVNGQMIAGPVPYERFAQLIDGALAKNAGNSPTLQASQAKPTQSEATAEEQKVGAREPATVFGATANNVFAQPSARSCSETEAANKQPTLIGTPEANQLHQSGSGVLFVDVRSSTEYAKGHIPDAANLPVERFDNQWSTLPRDKTLILYESGRSPGDVCASSRGAARVLLSHGYDFKRVKVYQNGLAGWESARLPVQSS